MPLKVSFDFYSKKGDAYDFSQKNSSTEVFAEDVSVPSKDDCCALLSKLMSRRDILVESIVSAEIFVAQLSVSVNNGEVVIDGYPENIAVPKNSTVHAVPVVTPSQAPTQPQETPRDARPTKNSLNDEISALMRGAAFAVSKTVRRVYYDPSDVHLVRLTKSNNLLNRGDVQHDNERSLVIAKKVYDIVAEADDPKGTGRVVVVRNEKGKLVHFPEHFAVDRVNGDMSTQIDSERGPQLDFGRVVATNPGDEIRSAVSSGRSSQSVDPAQLMEQFGIKPSRNIPG